MAQIMVILVSGNGCRHQAMTWINYNYFNWTTRTENSVKFEANLPLWSCLNSSWSSDATRWHRSGSILAQIMSCCLKATSHYLAKCWLFISGVMWHSPESNAEATIPYMSLKIMSLKFLPRLLGVKELNQSSRRRSYSVRMSRGAVLTYVTEYLLIYQWDYGKTKVIITVFIIISTY